MTAGDGGVGDAEMGGSLTTNDQRLFVDGEDCSLEFARYCCETRRHCSPQITPITQNLCNLWMELRNDAPVVVGSDWYGFVFLDPIDDQLADFFARAVDDGRVLVHDVPTAAVHPVIVRGETEFFRRRQWLAAKAQVLYSLSNRFGNIELVSDTFGDVEVVGGNFFIDEIAQRFAGDVSLVVLIGVFQRVFELLAGNLQHNQRIFVNVKTGNVAHAHRAFFDPCLSIETRHHRHVRLARFHLYFLNQIEDRGVAKPRFACR